MNPTPAQRQGMRAAILAQCFGAPAEIVFRYGLILLYLKSLGIPSHRILVYVSLPFLAYLAAIPLAYVSDRFGKSRLGRIGQVFTGSGFLGLVLAGFGDGAVAEGLVALAIVCYCAGNALFVSSWMALLSPVIPPFMRGRFFGRLRMSWQSITIVFMALSALFLSEDAPRRIYQLILGVLFLGQIGRYICYIRIPELEKGTFSPHKFRGAMLAVLRLPDYLPFCTYVFLLFVFTALAPSLFALIEKEVMGFGDDQVLWLGIGLMIGCVAGFFAGGKAVDGVGTKAVFLSCHLGYSAVLAAFPLARAVFPGAGLVIAAVLSVAFGVVSASSSIAVTSEMMALLPPKDKSLAAAFCMGMHMGGGGVGGVLSAAVLKAGMLKREWSVFGLQLTDYDAVLLMCSGMVLLLLVTLGQVRSVIGKTEWVTGR